MGLTFEALTGVLALRTQGWTGPLKAAQTDFQAFANNVSRISQQVGAGMRKVGDAVAAAGAAMTLAAAAAVKAGATFESTMARLEGVLSSRIKDADELKKAFASLGEEAKELGIQTVFSSQKAAEGMSAFALAGFKVAEIMQVMPGTLDLAAAAQVDVGVAADIVAKSLRGLGLEAANTGHLSDVMAKAFTSSNTDLVMLGDALRYVGPVTKMAGVSMEQAVAAIRALSDAGMQGQMAGTGLRNILSHLAANGREVKQAFGGLGVATKDVAGNLRPLADIIDDFNRRIVATGREADSAALVMTAFGERGGPAFANLLGLGGDALRRYESELLGASGTASKIAKTQLDTLHGSWILLTSSIQVLGIEIGSKLTPVLRGALDATTAWLNGNIDLMASGVAEWWAKLLAVASRVGVAFADVGRMAAPYLVAIKDRLLQVRDAGKELFERLPPWAKNVVTVSGTLTGLSMVLGGIGSRIPIIGGLFAGLGALLNPLGLLGGAFAVVSSAAGMFMSAFGVLSTAVTAGWGVLSGIAGAIVTGFVPALAAVNGGIMTVLGVVTAGFMPAMNAVLAGVVSVAGTIMAGFVPSLSALAAGAWGLVTGGLSALVTGFGSVVAAILGFISWPAVIVAGIVAIGVAIGVALTRSEKARAGLASIFKMIAGAAMGLVNGALKILADWWDRNKDAITRVGEKLIVMFKNLVEGSGKAAPFITDVLGGALRGVLTIVEKLLQGFEAFVDLLNGDSRRALVMTGRLVAGMSKAFAQMFESMGNIPVLGKYFKQAAADLRMSATLTEIGANVLERNLQKEEQGKKDAKANAEYQAQYKKRADAAAAQQKSSEQARLKEQRSYGIVNLDELQMERPLSEGDLEAVRKKRRAAGLPVQDKKPAAASTAPAPSPTAAPLSEPPAAASSAAAAAIPDATASSGAGAVSSPLDDGTETKKRKPVAALDPVEAGKKYGQAFSRATRDEALDLFKQMGEELEAAMKPDKKTGLINEKDVHTTLANYRIMLSYLPGFTQQAFDEVGKSVMLNVSRAAAASGDQVKRLFLERAKGAASEGGKVFSDLTTRIGGDMSQAMFASVSQVNRGSAYLAQQLTAQVDRLRQNTDVTPAQMAEITQLKQAALDATQSIAQASGENRKEAIADAVAAQKAYEDAYEKIAKTGKWAMSQLTKAEKQELASTKKTTQQMAAVEAQQRRARMAGANGAAPQAGQQPPPGANAAQQGQGGAQNGKGGQQGQQNGQGQQAPNLEGSSPEARRARIAMRQQLDASQADPMSAVGGMSNALSGVFNGAASLIGSGQAQLSDAVAQAKTPIEKFTLLVQNATAKLSMMRLNHTEGTIMDVARRELDGLEHKLAGAIAKQRHERIEGLQATQRSYQRMRAQQAQQAREERREQGLDLAGAAMIGKRNTLGAGNVVININGLNDARQALDNIELELRKRGWNKNAKRTLELRPSPTG